jgi:hypothetical protein
MRTDTKIFTAKVITSNSGSGAVTVHRESYGSVNSPDRGYMMQGTPISTTLSAFLGFKESLLPQPGSRVLCVEDYGANCFIIGVIPNQSMEFEDLPSRGMLGAKNAMDDSANRKGHENYTTILYDNRRPGDVVDGEHVISNEFGVLLGLYQQMANLKASELSQVQCFLLDDLVRIISHNFQHYTALGEYNIYHDGKRLMAEFGATHKAAESYGSPAVDSDEGEGSIFAEDEGHTSDDSADFYKITQDERIKAIERFKVFLGSVGDFIHMFVVRPEPTSIRALDPEAGANIKPDTGLCDVHLGVDGGMHIRSVKEIFIEKTNWIRVPLRKAYPDDPKGDDANDLAYDEKEKFQFIDDYTYKNNPFAYAMQLRDYVAYVNEKLNYQNFKKHEKDFYVNDDIDTEKNLRKIEHIDKETKLHSEQYQLRTAGIYLMPNGGITIRDAWNSAIVMEGGNVYIQPAKDLVSQPLRNSITKAGGSISMACKLHLDLSSSDEGIRVKSEKAQYYYSDSGGLIFESNSIYETPGTPDPAKEAVEYVGGIVLKSKLGIYNYAETDIVNYAKKRFLLQSLENLDIVSDKSVTAYGKAGTNIFSDEGIDIYSGARVYVIAETSAIFAGAAATILGQEDQKLGVMYDDKSFFVDVISGLFPVSDYTDNVKEIVDKKQNVLESTIFEKEEKFDDLHFKFLDSSKYGSLNSQEDGIPSTMAQQDDLLTDMYKLKEWEEKEVNDTLPFPGKDLFDLFYYSAEKPVNLEDNEIGKDYSNKADSVNKPAKIKLESLNKYKVQPK